jgi:nucleosome binding factor SPN SPT16 subunit
MDFAFKKLIDQIEEIVDDDDTIKMVEVSNKIKGILEEEENDDSKAFQKEFPNVDIANLDYTLPICIQSGGNFSYNLSAGSSENALKEDTIWLSMCFEYGGLCLSAGRTLKINPSREEKEDYILLRKVFAGLFKSMQIGRKISDCYNEVWNMLVKERDEEWLKKHLGKNFGYGIGFQPQENSLEITPHNHTVLEENMVLYIRLYFKDLEYREKSGFGIIIGDTIVLTQTKPRNLTKGIRKNYEDISYVIDDNEDEDEEEKEDVLEANGIDNANITESRLRTSVMNEKRSENMRKEHQDELLNIKLAELNERIANNEIVISSNKQKSKTMTDIKSYKNPKEVPTGIPMRKIFLDEKKDTLLLPVSK